MGGGESNHQGFKRWKDKDIWEKFMLNLSEPDLEYVMIDSTVVRSHACSAGYKKDTKKEEALNPPAILPFRKWDFEEAYQFVIENIISKLP